MTVRIEKPAINVREELADLRKPSGVAGEAMLRADTPQEQFNLIGAGRRNILYNGAFEIAQRGTSFTNVDHNDYTLDRWKIIEGSTAVFTATQSTDAPNGFAHSLKLDVTTADSSVAALDYCILNQPLEGYDIISFAAGTTDAKYHSLSFWVKSNVTGTFIAGLRYNDSGKNSGQAYTIDQADTWEHKTVVFPPQTTNAPSYDSTEDLSLYFWLLAGSNYSGGSSLGTGWSTTDNTRAVGQTNLVASTDNEFYITGVQLEVGKVATPFEHRSYGEELALCQRYFQRYPSSAPADLGSYAAIGGFGNCISTTVFEGCIVLPVTMRIEPTMSPSASGAFRVYHENTNTVVTSGPLITDVYSSAGQVSIRATVGSAALTIGNGGQLQQSNDNDAHISLDSEL
jgi:hypothetical protein